MSRLLERFTFWRLFVRPISFSYRSQWKREKIFSKTNLSIGSVESWSLSTAHCFFSAWSFLAFWSAIFCLKYLMKIFRNSALQSFFRIYFETNRCSKRYSKTVSKRSFLKQLNFVLNSHSNYAKFKRLIKRLIWLIRLIWPKGKYRLITWLIPVQLIVQLEFHLGTFSGRLKWLIRRLFVKTGNFGLENQSFLSIFCIVVETILRKNLQCRFYILYRCRKSFTRFLTPTFFMFWWFSRRMFTFMDLSSAKKFQIIAKKPCFELMKFYNGILSVEIRQFYRCPWLEIF